MNRDPILAARPLPKGTDGYRFPLWFQVEGGLHRIGDQRPYFSLTYTQHRRGFRDQCYAGGAGHETIARYFGDRFADLAALHLSDIDGVPMHAEANGWYQLAGAMGGAGERYHAGNATYGDTSPDACLAAFARHCRISIPEAEMIRLHVSGYTTPYDREKWGEIMEMLRPRWKAEAKAAIERHHLRVYGDPA